MHQGIKCYNKLTHDIVSVCLFMHACMTLYNNNYICAVCVSIYVCVSMCMRVCVCWLHKCVGEEEIHGLLKGIIRLRQVATYVYEWVRRESISNYFSEGYRRVHMSYTWTTDQTEWHARPDTTCVYCARVWIWVCIICYCMHDIVCMHAVQWHYVCLCIIVLHYI